MAQTGRRSSQVKRQERQVLCGKYFKICQAGQKGKALLQERAFEQLANRDRQLVTDAMMQKIPVKGEKECEE